MKDIDQLCAELRATEPYLNDHGFTAVVMEQLPRSRDLPEWVKNAILLGAAILGTAIFAAWVPGGVLAQAVSRLFELPSLNLQYLLEVVAQNLPVVLVASVVISYVVPCGALIIARRSAL
ncbi:MAG: hypothetical protein HYR49_02680 [Gammaproteobacteria bacterium]|nr:hypothetical protein [Gammaproteobacteria bacterium]